jgi:Flp pilus assembly pilin Flp
MQYSSGHGAGRRENNNEGRMAVNLPSSVHTTICRLGGPILKNLRGIWSNDEGQDIAEYAVMLAVILVIVIGTVRLIGGNTNNVFSTVASDIK